VAEIRIKKKAKASVNKTVAEMHIKKETETSVSKSVTGIYIKKENRGEGQQKRRRNTSKKKG
jgi:hypothetical protein